MLNFFIKNTSNNYYSKFIQNHFLIKKIFIQLKKIKKIESYHIVQDPTKKYKKFKFNLY